MELEEAIKTRRSIRKYLDRPVPRDVLEPILLNALWAPSNSNKQNWRVLAVTGEKRNSLVGIFQGCKDNLKRKLEITYKDKPHIVDTTLKYFDNFGGAPVLLLIYVPQLRRINLETATDPEKIAYFYERKTNTGGAVALAYNITLLAHEAGLGTCWMTAPVFVEHDVNDYLGIQDEELIAVVALGYPDQAPKAPPRKGQPITFVGFD